MSRKAQQRNGLFNGHWELVHDEDGRRRNVRIQRSEYPELYRLHRICVDTERGVAGARAIGGYLVVDGASQPAPSLREHPAYTEDNPFH